MSISVLSSPAAGTTDPRALAAPALALVDGRLAAINAAAARLLDLDPASALGATTTATLRSLVGVLAHAGGPFHLLPGSHLDTHGEAGRPAHGPDRACLVLLSEQAAQAGIACVAMPDPLEESAQCQRRAAIGQLSGGLTHELNGPLGFVMSNFGTLERHVGQLMALLDAALDATAATPAGAQPRTAATNAELDYLREDLPALFAESSEGLARIQRLLRDMADYSRPGDRAPAYLDIRSSVESALNLLRNEIKYKADVSCDFAPLPPLWCVPSQLRQVLMILIANAAEAVAAGGRITVSARCDEALLRVEVSTTAGAIPIRKADTSIEVLAGGREPVGGAEPNLLIAAELVRRHGGVLETLCAADAALSVSITLPLLAPRDSSAVEPG